MQREWTTGEGDRHPPNSDSPFLSTREVQLAGEQGGLARSRQIADRLTVDWKHVPERPLIPQASSGDVTLKSLRTSH